MAAATDRNRLAVSHAQRSLQEVDRRPPPCTCHKLCWVGDVLTNNPPPFTLRLHKVFCFPPGFYGPWPATVGRANYSAI